MVEAVLIDGVIIDDEKQFLMQCASELEILDLKAESIIRSYIENVRPINDSIKN